ncbi:type VI secretion system baseplate subunit TssK, partial [Aliiroseovarius sp.]|uniref:type VI secretion system baseplate subunit TssK n=1 Tax=Aliiroseovarius sp. TaxID=1872442 RepID=UPI003BAB03CC
MSQFSKVAWKEGLFLQPQHFQQADRYLEKLVQDRTGVITPYPWGMIEMRIDRDMTQHGRFGLRTAVGLMP